MQSSGPPYQGAVGAGVNYPERQYENQMSARCHSASYPSYQPSSPYRPHPVSPQAHSHQYNSHGNHQMHSSMVYGASHQLGAYDGTGHQVGPYASAPQSHFGASNQELYSSRHMYSSGNRNMQQVKTAWGESGGSSTSEANQGYSQPSSRPTMMVNPPHMPPPSMRSPPHGAVSATPASSLAPAHHHYRSLPVGSSPSQSPHSWPQTQIPSPGVLHSPRTTPSPLPAHARSPGHSQPFSPPPTTPSPHHPPSSVTPHSAQPSSKIAASPPSSNCQTLNQPGSDPLQSLQKMVMLDSDTGEPPMARGSYDIPNSHSNSQTRSYFGSVEQLAGSNPGSPYPTYYNLDQNRLCTPPCTQILTPTTSAYSSIPDSVSNSSASSDSRTALSCSDTTIPQQNGEISQSNGSEIKRDFEKMNSTSKDNVMNGDGQQSGLDGTENNTPSQPREDPVTDTRDSCADWNNRLSAKNECSVSDDAKDLTVSSPVCKRSNNHVDVEFCHSPQDTVIEKQIKSRSILSPSKRNLVMQEVAISNGPVGNGDESILQTKFNCASTRWNNIESLEGRNHTTDVKDCYPEEEQSVFEKQSTPAAYLPQHSSNPCNLIWMRDDVKNMSSKSCPVDTFKNRTENGGTTEKNIQDASKDPNEETKPSVQKLDVGISSFLGKEEKKESWQHPDLHVGPSPSEEKSQEDCVPNEPSSDCSVKNTSLPLKSTVSEPPVVPINENDQSKESKLSSSSTPRLPTKDSSHSARSDDCNATYSQNIDVTPRRKRGRPYGSKNKPKTPGEKPEKKSANAKRKKGEIEQKETETIKKKVKAFNGPYVHIVGTKEKPLSISVINVAPKEEVKDIKYPKQKREFHLGSNLHKKLGMGHTSTLSPLYDAFTKDKTWVCALCQRGSHYRSLGDLFGPYFFVEDKNNPGIHSNSNTPVDVNKTEQKDTSVPSKNACVARRVRSKRKRSELVEEFFKASMSKKTKQQVKKPTEAETNVTESPPTQPVISASNSGNEFWIHEDCALWSHGVCLNGQRVHGVEDAVREASGMVCSKCKLNGATLGCLNKGCSEQYHFICATDKGCEMDEENFSLLCPRHRKRSHGEKRAVVE